MSERVGVAPSLLKPTVRRVRAYFAASGREGAGAVFDPGGLAGFDVDRPPAPWVDLGWVAGFARSCGTAVVPLLAGAPGMAAGQVRTEVGAEVRLEFERWGKVQLALSCGAQQMNVLAGAVGAGAAGSGGVAVPAVAVSVGTSSASVLDVGAAVGGFGVGDLVAVDMDYAGQTGFVGAGLAGAYVRVAAAIADADYVRRVTLNVGRVVSIAGTVLTLETPLLAGAPVAGMKVSRVAGFCDREGGTFFQEFAGLFVCEGMQGDRVSYFYPRLQTAAGAAETRQALDGELGMLRLAGRFRALPVVDPCDGERVVCFRSYVPPGVVAA